MFHRAGKSIAKDPTARSTRPGRIEEGTLFSEKRFIDAVAHASPGDVTAIRLLTSRDGFSEMYAVEHRHTMGRRSVALGPFGLYASPNVPSSELREAVSYVVAKLKTYNTISFTWNVRYDHAKLQEFLAEKLPSAPRQHITHVLALTSDYEAIEKRFTPTIRNQIRRASREHVSVRNARSCADVEAYYAIHCRLAEQKGHYGNLHPRNLFGCLLELRHDVRLILAERDQVILGGGIFFCDGNSMFYWHGAIDRQYSKIFPACAVLSDAIRTACSAGFRTFNFGASLGIRSLEQFKEFWGAEPARCYSFTYSNPLLRRLARVRAWINA